MTGSRRPRNPGLRRRAVSFGHHDILPRPRLGRYRFLRDAEASDFVLDADRLSHGNGPLFVWRGNFTIDKSHSLFSTSASLTWLFPFPSSHGFLHRAFLGIGEV